MLDELFDEVDVEVVVAEVDGVEVVAAAGFAAGVEVGFAPELRESVR